MRVPLSRAAGILLGASLLIGCGGNGDEGGGLPTAPGFTTPRIVGVYSGPTFWSFEATRLADGARLGWSCGGRVQVIRQSGPDFLGTFGLSPSDGQRCEAASGEITSGIIRRNAGISFNTAVPGQDPNEFFALPSCVVVSGDGLWTGTANGDRFVANRRLTVDCPGDGRLDVTGRADGSRTF